MLRGVGVEAMGPPFVAVPPAQATIRAGKRKASGNRPVIT